MRHLISGVAAVNAQHGVLELVVAVSAASRQCLHRVFIGTAHVRGGALALRSQCGAGCSDGSVYCVHACLRALCVDAVPLVRSSISHSRTARDKSQRGRLQSDFTDWACCNAPSSAASRQCLHRAFIGTAYVRGDALTSEELRGSFHDAGCARNECAFLSVSW